MTAAAIDTIQTIADQLIDARRSRRPVPPIRSQLPAGDIDAAYQVQRLNVARLEREGHRRVGRKIGLTSRAVQQQLGVDQPDFGVLFDFMDFGRSPFAVSALVAPRIEAEFAFLVGRDIVAEELGPEDLAAHLDAVAASAEIVDSAIDRWDINIVDTVADNASSGGFVVGPWQPYLRDIDLPARKMRLTRNGEEVSSGVGAATLGDPLNAVSWLADVSVARGDPLHAGEIVLAGALGPMTALVAGDYVVEIDGFPLLFMRATP